LISHSFYPVHFFDMVGVTGSIPVAPTILLRATRFAGFAHGLSRQAGFCLQRL